MTGITSEEEADLVEEKVRRLALFFYKVKGMKVKHITPSHRQWVHFERIRNYLINAGLAKDWKTYIVAQFTGRKDPMKVQPAMLYHSTAVRRYESRVAFKGRRFGHVYKAELQAEPEMSPMRLFGDFTSSAWCVRQYEKDGFSKEEMFKAFPLEFHPLFILADREGWVALQGGVRGFDPAVYGYFNQLQGLRESKRNRVLQNLRIIYEKAFLKVKATY